MNVSDPGKNVNLRIDSISRAMVGNIPDLLIDLLEIAAYVYCVDQRIKRGTEKLMDYGKDWRRSLTFSIPVRHPEVWNREEVQELLVKTLGFLSDDSYAFRFRNAEAPVQPRDPYFHEGARPAGGDARDPTRPGQFHRDQGTRWLPHQPGMA